MWPLYIDFQLRNPTQKKERKVQLRKVLFFPTLLLFQSFQNMRTLSRLLPLMMIFAIMLATVHLCSCRQVTWASYQQTQHKLATKSSTSFPKHFPVLGNQKYRAVHGVSHKLVPGGPNPLHNWSKKKKKTLCFYVHKSYLCNIFPGMYVMFFLLFWRQRETVGSWKERVESKGINVIWKVSSPL